MTDHYEGLKLPELHKKAKELNIEGQSTMRKGELLESIKARTEPTPVEEPTFVSEAPTPTPKTVVYNQSTAEMISEMRDLIQKLGSQLYAFEQSIQGGTSNG